MHVSLANTGTFCGPGTHSATDGICCMGLSKWSVDMGTFLLAVVSRERRFRHWREREGAPPCTL